MAGGSASSGTGGAAAELSPTPPVGEGLLYTPVGPTRLLDTRRPVGPSNPATGAVGPGEVLELEVSTAVPDARSVVVNVTVTGGSAASDLVIWPKGDPMPPTSNLNWAGGETVANLVTVAVGVEGRIVVRNRSGSAHVVVDIQGAWGPAGVWIEPMAPQRVLDTRSGVPFGALTAGVPQDLVVTGTAGVPLGADAVLVNVTATGGTTASDLRLWPAGETAPHVSNLNWPAGDTRANLAIVPVGDDGAISLGNRSGSVSVIVDVVGYAAGGGGSEHVALDATRLFDTRSAASPLTGAFTEKVARDVVVTGGAVPADATAVVLNLTATGGSAASDLRVWPAGGPVPTASNLNWPAGATRPNLVVAKVGDDGEIRIRNQSGTVHVVGDLVGYLRPVGAIDPGVWTEVSPPPDLAGGGDAWFDMLSCAAVDRCVADLAPTLPSGEQIGDSLLATWDGDAWSTTALPDLGAVPELDYVMIRDLSCGTVSSCAAALTGELDDESFWAAAHWNGADWVVEPIGVVIGEERRVTCRPDATCRVTGGTGPGSDLVWNGDAWESADPVAPPPLPARAAEVTCAAADECMLIGVAPTPVPGVSQAVQMAWDGSGWSHMGALPVGLASQSSAGATWIWHGVSCVSPHECLAVARFDDDTLRTIAWDGQRWHRVADRPGFSTASAEIDGSLDCAPEWCMAVGSEWDGSALRATAHIRTPSTPPAG